MNKPKKNLLGLKGKTAWDWAQLLFIPIVLLIGGYILDSRQSNRQNLIEEMRISEQQKRDKTTNCINALNHYIEVVSTLIVQNKLGSTESSYSIDRDTEEKMGQMERAQKVARALTSSTVPQLDAQRKGQLMLFLHGANIITPSGTLGSWFNLAHINLKETQIHDAYLQEIDLHDAILENSKITKSDLTQSNLSFANLKGADLSGTNMFNTDLSVADLRESKLIDSIFEKADLVRAKLANATLTNSYFSRANLSGADFSEADLTGSNFTNANLSGANFQDVIGLTQEQLDLAFTLEDKPIRSLPKRLSQPPTKTSEEYLEWIKKRND